MSESLSERARTALLAALVGDPVEAPPAVVSEVVRLVTNPDLLLWDVLWRDPQDCLAAAFLFDLPEGELLELVRYARQRLSPLVLLRRLGSHTVERDRLSQQLLWLHQDRSELPSVPFWSRPASRTLLQDLVSAPGPLTASTALALWHLPYGDRPLLTAASAALLRCPPPVLEVLRTLALDEVESLGPYEDLERFRQHVGLGSILEGAELPLELLELQRLVSERTTSSS